MRNFFISMYIIGKVLPGPQISVKCQILMMTMLDLDYTIFIATPFRCAAPFDLTVLSVREYLGLSDLLKIHE